MKRIEILAPAGGFESVAAAVRSGADAVYLGSKSFSARAGAENFSDDELAQATAYCHIRGVKVYLTLNTVAFDDELEEIRSRIIAAAKADVDALLVQNIGVASLAREIAPDLPLHASTQMSVHSPGGAKLLWEMGFKRVVISRELSREEIREIVESCPIEVEAFVHGALCMSVSGQCYFSSVLGQRSGNRGRCAQPCRLPFSVKGKNGYALSLKDMSLISRIKEMESIGVVSAKIEGRLKRPEYVAAAVAACVSARDNGFVEQERLDELEKVFSRSGFTDGYYTSRRGVSMFGHRTREDVTSATSKLFAEIRSRCKDELARVKLTGRFTAKEGQLPSLWLSDGVNTVEVYGEETAQRAVNLPCDDQRARAQLCKTGGTPFSINELEVKLDENIALPVSQLNRLRRHALRALSAKRERVNNYNINDIELPEITPHKSEKTLSSARFANARIGNYFKSFDLCYIPYNTPGDEVRSLIGRGFNVGAEIPRALFSREDDVRAKLGRMKELGVNDVLCNNLAAVYIGRELGMRIHGGFGLNFTNTRDLQWAQSFGFADAELSFETDFNRIKQLGADIPRGIITFGYLPLMLTRNCPNRSVTNSCKGCGGTSKMTDRLGKSFIFYCDGCSSEVLNTVPLDVVGEDISALGLDFGVFRFSVENCVENVENEKDFSAYRLKITAKTNGLYRRPII